jgi:2-deoxy-D-gluconate 3-dehydrogenase
MSAGESPFDLAGRVAIVTGGNGGIGRAIALGLARAGAAVAVLARDEAKNARVLEELQAIGVPAAALRLDVTRRNDLQQALLEVEQRLGSLDILVNNAGVAMISGGVLNESEVSWDTTIETHLNASFLLSKLAAASMVKRGRGKIINLASMYSFFGSGVVPSYSAAKGAIVQLTKSMAIELAPYNIQVNALAPGWVETEMTALAWRNPDADWTVFNQRILDRTPCHRWGKPEEMSGAAVFLASQASDFVTGVTLPVDGGYSIS